MRSGQWSRWGMTRRPSIPPPWQRPAPAPSIGILGPCPGLPSPAPAPSSRGDRGRPRPSWLGGGFVRIRQAGPRRLIPSIPQRRRRQAGRIPGSAADRAEADSVGLYGNQRYSCRLSGFATDCAAASPPRRRPRFAAPPRGFCPNPQPRASPGPCAAPSPLPHPARHDRRRARRPAARWPAAGRARTCCRPRPSARLRWSRR